MCVCVWGGGGGGGGGEVLRGGVEGRCVKPAILYVCAEGVGCVQCVGVEHLLDPSHVLSCMCI